MADANKPAADLQNGPASSLELVISIRPAVGGQDLTVDVKGPLMLKMVCLRALELARQAIETQVRPGLVQAAPPGLIVPRTEPPLQS
jgi:hypothetical protein